MSRSIYIPVFIFFMFGTLFSIGQSYVGILAGINNSRLAGDSSKDANYNSFIGANVGAYFDLKLSKSIWLSLQPSYSQEGTKVFYNVWGIERPVDSIHLRLNYFSLPLLIKVQSTNKRFYALSGIEAGYLLDSYKLSHEIKEEIESNVSNYNIAAHFGAGFLIPVGFGRIVIELRYTQGIVNLTDNLSGESIVPRVKTTGYKILAGFEIPLNKSNK
jgi:hypothetical protein